MNPKLNLTILLVACILVLMVDIAVSNSRPPRNNDISNMADALKYLQDLDSYYGDRSRTRFGKRTLIAQYLMSRLMDSSDTVHEFRLNHPDEIF